MISTVSVVGFHCWPDAPEVVKYLGSPHRHVFRVRAEFEVDHAERQVEFHTSQGWVLAAIGRSWEADAQGWVLFGASSCETIATTIAGLLPVAPSAIEVWEDDENGGRVEFEFAR